MLRKIWKCICLKADCLSNTNQVASETVHGAKLSNQRVNCDIYTEENKDQCKGDHIIDKKNRGRDVDQPQTNKANSSFLHSAINMIGMLIGLGQLSTAYALENGGWASSFLLIGLGVICAYSAYLLGRCLHKNPKARSYVDIGHHAFGSRGRIVAAAFIYMEIFMALVSYTISLHDNLTIIFSNTRFHLPWLKLSTPQTLTVLAVLVALPSLWLRDLSSISFLSIGGILMALVILISVAGTAVFGYVKANHHIPVLQIHKIPDISGLYMFSYAGHIVFPNLYKSMEDPSQFNKVLVVSFLFVTTLYTALAFMGAKLFGEDVNSQITLSMPKHLLLSKIALWATVLTPMTKYALQFAPFAIQLEHNLPHKMSSKTKMIIRGSVGSFLLVTILILALSVPYFEYVLSLTGSLVSVCICVILPCTFYTKICWGHIPRRQLVLNFTLIGFGCIMGISGTFFSAKSLIQNLGGHP